jgi:hypothetical protein
MKKIATTLLLACALLGAGCSGPDEPTVAGPPPTLTPMPDFTQEELAAMKAADANKPAEQKRQEETALAAPMPTAFPALTVVPLDIKMSTLPPTATPAP